VDEVGVGDRGDVDLGLGQGSAGKAGHAKADNDYHHP
jgi:hypothetical protein